MSLPSASAAEGVPDPDEAERLRTYQWGDPAISAAAARQVDGLTFFREIAAGKLPIPPMMATLGLEAVSFEPGQAVFAFEPAEYHLQPDRLGARRRLRHRVRLGLRLCRDTLLPAGAYYTSLDLSVRFIRPILATTGRLTCEGTVENIGSRTALATARLTNAEGKLFAHATSNCLIFRP